MSRLYQQLGVAVVEKLGLQTQALHLDSTSFHYDGKETEEGELNHIRITKGYSRDHRPELNQAILNLICENQSGIVYHAGTTNLKEAKALVKKAPA